MYYTITYVRIICMHTQIILMAIFQVRKYVNN